MIAPLLSRLAPYKLMFEIIAKGALAVGSTIAAHELLEHERKIGRTELQARWDKQVAIDKLATAAKTSDWTNQLMATTTDGAKREDTIRSLGARATSVTSGMLDTTAKIDQAVPDYSVDALHAVD